MSGQHQELLEAQGQGHWVLSLVGSPLLESPRELSHMMRPCPRRALWFYKMGLHVSW